MSSSTFDPIAYWKWRYRTGGTSGAGSRGCLADFKAAMVNGLIGANMVDTMIDLGCGDGVQMAMIDAAGRSGPDYLGVDVSPEALALCRSLAGDNPRRQFLEWSDFIARDPPIVADLALSMDVIYHLTDDDVFYSYLDCLFRCANRFVFIYSSNIDAKTADIHVRHRRFTEVVAHRFPGWRLSAVLPNRFGFNPARPTVTSFADFYIYTPNDAGVTLTVPAMRHDGYEEPNHG